LIRVDFPLLLNTVNERRMGQLGCPSEIGYRGNVQVGLASHGSIMWSVQQESEGLHYPDSHRRGSTVRQAFH